jgi:hypothetical protein
MQYRYPMSINNGSEVMAIDYHQVLSANANNANLMNQMYHNNGANPMQNNTYPYPNVFYNTGTNAANDKSTNYPRITSFDFLSSLGENGRSISAENFAERMRDLENVAVQFGGVEKAYAISAGREVRIFVKPTEMDDLGAIKLARDVATKIESTMQYPGTIKVNVIRETRAIEFAK